MKKYLYKICILSMLLLLTSGCSVKEKKLTAIDHTGKMTILSEVDYDLELAIKTKKDDYKVYDSKGKEIKAETKTGTDGLVVSVPKDTIEEGTVYHLFLDKTDKFVDEEYQDIRQLYFTRDTIKESDIKIQAEDIVLPESIMISDTALNFNDMTCLIKNDYLGFAEEVPVKADRILTDGNELSLVDNCVDIKDLIEGEHILNISFVYNDQTYISKAKTYFQLPVNSKSDDEFLEYANSVVEDAKDKDAAMRQGNFLEQSWEPIQVIDGWEFFPVIGSVNSMEGLKNEWHKYFAERYDIPDAGYTMYKEINGKLCTGNGGVGSDLEYRSIQIDSIENKSKDEIFFRGQENRENLSTGKEYYITIKFSLVYEDETWKYGTFQYLESTRDQSRMLDEVIELPSSTAESEDCREVLVRYLTGTGRNVSELVVEEVPRNDGNTEYVGFHVYEDYPDHTATIGWYDVHKSTHEIIDTIMGDVVQPGNN